MQSKLRQVVTPGLSGGPTVLIRSGRATKKSSSFFNQIIFNNLKIYFFQKAKNCLNVLSTPSLIAC